MREYEFSGNDVVRDMEQMIQESINATRANLIESIEEDIEYVQSFVELANGYNIDETSLIVGEYYCPMVFAANYQNKRIEIAIVIKVAKFEGVTGGRLRFIYDNCNIPMFFPTDLAIPSTWDRFVYKEKDHLDQTIVNLALKFRGTDWVITAKGYDEHGAFRPINNI